MLLRPWLCSLRSLVSARRRPVARRSRIVVAEQSATLNTIEALEDRTLLSTVGLVNGRVMVIGDADADELEIDVRFDAAGVDGVGIYLFVQDLTW